MQRHFEPQIPLKDRKIAYFSMEIGLKNSIPTYSGGLGLLAGDMLKSLADMRMPAIAITLLYRKGYFYQKLDAQGIQTEEPYIWDPLDEMRLLPESVSVKIGDADVRIQAWEYTLKGQDGFELPVIFLDADCEENSEENRTLTEKLYGGDGIYRLKQEIILGIAGIRILEEIGCTNSKMKYHMNEGHSAFLGLELFHKYKKTHPEATDQDIMHLTRDKCVFTTHTPVPAGHDLFDQTLVKNLLGDYMPDDILSMSSERGHLDMTYLAMNFSRFINGVAKRHREVAENMYPNYQIKSITNGIHTYSWVAPAFATLFDKYLPDWDNDPLVLRNALKIPLDEIHQAHLTEKKHLIEGVNQTLQADFDPNTFTIGFARRITEYKRPLFIFQKLERLIQIHKNAGPLQIIFSGKSHPQDLSAKDMIRQIYEYDSELKDSIKVVFLPNYDISLAQKLVAGVDMWLNTPLAPNEASGTSGMKAALNGVPQMSILDGWWNEGCIENQTGWAIGTTIDELEEFYTKLEKTILPLYYKNIDQYIHIMRNCIAINGSYFNTHRMAKDYISQAYYD
jgi:starch phosphorylase